ncbi:MAG: hypothetical protein ACTHU0_26030 [Kofleriaceae bacterium]
MHRACLAWIALAACSPAPPVAEPSPPMPIRPPDAAIATDAAPPDAGPPEAVLQAPAWVFRYRTAQRSETWTLRFANGAALLEVESAQGVLRYLGSATEGATLALNVSTSSAKMVLDCKREQRPIGAACNDAKAKPIAVLDCYHADFAAPMPFGLAPGIEYVVDEQCNGYRLAQP